MTRLRIPVVVLAGFLGSGKTTLLNRLLRGSRGTRIGAVVNDFGSIEIDAMAVAGQADAMVSLGDGCLCCAVDTSDLDEVLETLARPSARMDVIVVEASGLAEPETLIRMILASGNPHIVYGGLVEVVDAAEFSATRARHPELDRHVGIADLVVLNKADRVAGPVLDEITGTLSRLAPGTPVVVATHGRVDPELLFDRPERERPAVEQLSFDQLALDEDAEGDTDGCADGCAGGHGAHAGHPHAAYESLAFSSDRPLDPRRLMTFLDARPGGLYRIKGFVDFGAADPLHTYALHAVGGFLRFEPRRWAGAEQRRTQLVLIGSGIDTSALREQLTACTVGPDGPDEPASPGGPDPTGMWGVLRYVDDDGEDELDGYAQPEPEPEPGEPACPAP